MESAGRSRHVLNTSKIPILSWGSGAAFVQNKRRTSSFGTCACGKFSQVTRACRLLEVWDNLSLNLKGGRYAHIASHALISPLKYHNNLGVSTANNPLTEWTLNNHLGRRSDHHRSWRNHLDYWSDHLQSGAGAIISGTGVIGSAARSSTSEAIRSFSPGSLAT